jgi:ABC-type branched-subunit amino acid transport system substrate-binding protein
VCARRSLARKPIAMIGCEPFWSTSGLLLYGKAKVPSFNCQNQPVDFTNPWSFGVLPGGTVEYAAFANYLCTRKDIKTVGFLSDDAPQLHSGVPPVLDKIFGACGKKASYTWMPIDAADRTPYVSKVVQTKPDFVMVNKGGPAWLTIMKAFQQQGYPSKQIYSGSAALDYDELLKPAGSTIEGSYFTSPVQSWADTGNADVQAYEKATAETKNPHSFGVESGYVQIMWLYTVAKHLGFDKFTGESLADFMRTQSGVHVPLSRTMLNPGPAGLSQMKQPYAQIQQWRDGAPQIVTEGTEDGWVSSATEG